MLSTFFYHGRFLKKLADDQCSSIIKWSIHYIKTYVHTSLLMEVSTMFYICTYCVFTLRGITPTPLVWGSILITQSITSPLRLCLPLFSVAHSHFVCFLDVFCHHLLIHTTKISIFFHLPAINAILMPHFPNVRDPKGH